jgi:hypothetical protein
MGGSSVISSDSGFLSWGARLAIGTFAMCQFVEFTFFYVGSTAISVQKIAAAVLLPVSVLLMTNWIRPNISLCVIAGALSLAYSLSNVVAGSVSSKMVSANFFVATSLFASTVLFAALTEGESAPEFMGKVWVLASVLSAMITICQVLGVLGWQYRGTGMKGDPNFQALMLLIGFVFAFVYSKHGRIEILLIIFLGILATYSRTGLVLVCMVLVLGCFLDSELISEARRKWLFLVIAAGLLAGMCLVLGYERIDVLVLERFARAIEHLTSLFSGGTASVVGNLDLDSSQIRIILAYYSIVIALENWPTGIGAFRTSEILYDRTGFPDSVNNTPLDLFLIGGMWGLIAYVLLWAVIMRCYWRIRSNAGKPKVKLLMILLITIFFGSSLLLSLTYNSILWLWPTVALAFEHLSRGEHQKSADMENNKG